MRNWELGIEAIPAFWVGEASSTIKYALSLWAAGIGTLDFVKEASASIPEQAQHADQARGRLATDSWLRVVGRDSTTRHIIVTDTDDTGLVMDKVYGFVSLGVCCTSKPHEFGHERSM